MTCAPRYATPRTPSRETLGEVAAKIARQLGREPMPWQQDWWDLILEVDDDGTFAFRDVTLLVPRQSGKSFAVECYLLTRALDHRNQRLKFTSQTLNDARKAMIGTWLPELDRSPLSAYYTPRLANGSECIRFTNGSELALVASTVRAGHGSANDVAVIDEAFSQPDDRMEQALIPSMATRKSPQFVVVSNAGTPHGSPYLLNRVEQGRQMAGAGLTDTSCYVEYSAPNDVDPSDPDTWRMANPAMGHTISESAIRAELAALDLTEFRRARLCQWTTAVIEPVVPLAQWNALADLRAAAPDRISVAFDVTPDRAMASIAVAGKRDDGRFFAELVDNEPGTEWVPRRMAELVEKYHPDAVLCDPAGPAGSLGPVLTDLGIEVTKKSPRCRTRPGLWPMVRPRERGQPRPPWPVRAACQPRWSRQAVPRGRLAVVSQVLFHGHLAFSSRDAGPVGRQPKQPTPRGSLDTRGERQPHRTRTSTGPKLDTSTRRKRVVATVDPAMSWPPTADEMAEEVLTCRAVTLRAYHLVVHMPEVLEPLVVAIDRMDETLEKLAELLDPGSAFLAQIRSRTNPVTVPDPPRRRMEIVTMEFRRRKPKQQSPELREALAALNYADRAKSPSRRAKALVALRRAREHLNEQADVPTMREVMAVNWSTARCSALSDRLNTTIKTLEGNQ